VPVPAIVVVGGHKDMILISCEMSKYALRPLTLLIFVAVGSHAMMLHVLWQKRAGDFREVSREMWLESGTIPVWA